MKRKADYRIGGYDPKKKQATRKSYPCPDCWYVAYTQTGLTRHKNMQHWDKANGK